MSSALEQSASPTDTRPSDERKQSPPAFLDLADSAARLGSNMPDISARVELKRMEHERQRVLQRKLFEEQMRALEQQQQQELLSLPIDGSANNAMQHLAVSAPTTPPRVNSALAGDAHHQHARFVDPKALSTAVGKADKRKSVTYHPMTSNAEFEMAQGEAISHGGQGGFSRPIGAKSMPASRRTSTSEHDEELAKHLQGLSMGERQASPMSSTAPQPIGRAKGAGYGNAEGAHYIGNGTGYNAGTLLDEQLDKEMHNAMLHMPISDDDKFGIATKGDYNKLSTSSAALDLAPLSQTPPRTSFMNRAHESREKSSEWPQFTSASRGADGVTSRNDRRTVTTPQIGALHSAGLGDLQSKLNGTMSASGTPLLQSHTPGVSRRSSPLGGGAGNLRPDLLVKTPGTPQSSSDVQSLSSRLAAQGLGSDNDLSASLSRISPSQYDSPITFGSSNSLDEQLQAQYDADSLFLNERGLDNGRFNGYSFDGNSRVNGGSIGGGSTALYHHSGSRFGLGMGGRLNGPDAKMNGLHGPKHKRGDIDLNRFAGTRLEELQGEIANLCKDQHGCRFLQKKLEEGVPEHRDMIFRETFGHFAELMIDPFGNYLCQKLLEYSTDDQRNLICESVAQDLVNISLNMHGTRAVQKMIDFLSTQRQASPSFDYNSFPILLTHGRKQADLRYNAQIHSIIVALSLHVVVLIKDLNGNHVIQKCLNKLAPEDNQFIYNAVAANCVEVATHRHGCCVLQRCIDHASDQQRIQLVNEITYNALTLVQDPYGNYVVQYILDLNDNRFSDAVIRQFTGNVCALSVQKFSSNVIEKCIRVAEHTTRKMLIEELLNRTRLEKLLRDSFGNYCVQTALDYAEASQRALLVEGIRPILPLIRNTPYGKRIQSKLQREQMELAGANGMGQYGGGAPYGQQSMMNLSLNTQGLGPQGQSGINQGRHIGHPVYSNSIGDMHSSARSPIYGMSPGAQNGLGHANGLHSHGIQQPLHHLHNQPLHSLQPQSIDSYVLQSGHSHGLGSGNGFAGVGGFSNGIQVSAPYAGSLTGGLSDPYQRTTYGYGM